MAGAQGGEGGGVFPRFGRTLDTGDYRTVPNVTEQDLATLDEREREVVRLAFGLPDGEPASYPEIGKKLGVSGERVRQIRNAALGKLQRIVNPDWPWPKGQAPQGWRLKDALDTAGFCWPSGNDWPPDQLPTGFDPAGHPAAPEVGLAEEEIVPGIASLRMDPLLLLRDARVVNPPDRERMGIGVFVCVSSAEDRDETTWVALTQKARPDRLPIESRWRTGGNYKWRRRKLYLMDAGRWIGPRGAFVSAAWREAFNEFPERAGLTVEGLAVVRASVLRVRKRD